MIHGTKQQGDIVGIVPKCRKILGVALGDGNRLPWLRILPEDLNIMADQLHGIDLIPLLRQIMAVPPGSSADLHDPHTGLKILLDISHGGQKFYDSIPGA